MEKTPQEYSPNTHILAADAKKERGIGTPIIKVIRRMINATIINSIILPP